MPLQLRGVTRDVALERAGDHWSCREHYMCGFVPMRGAGAVLEHRISVHEDVTLRLDEQVKVDTAGVRTSLLQPPVERAAGVEVASSEPFDGLHLWLATALPHVGKLSVDQRAIDADMLASMARTILIAVDDASFAYHAGFRHHVENTRHEFVVHAHGPDAERLAD